MRRGEAAGVTDGMTGGTKQMGIKKACFGFSVHVPKLVLFLIKITSESIWYGALCFIAYVLEYTGGLCHCPGALYYSLQTEVFTCWNAYNC